VTERSGSEQLTALDREAVRDIDRSGIVSDALAMPEHLRDALWKAESANLGDWDSPGGLVVAGMGGSSIGCELARAALGDQASRSILGTRSYGLPAWTQPDTTVLCASYSGDTEETLACYEAAGALGAPRVVATTGGKLADLARRDGVPVVPVAGGLQPRAAVAYMVVGVLEVAARCGAGPALRPEVDVAAEGLEAMAAEWGPDGPEDNEAKALARELAGSVPVIAGAGLTAPIAYRWKTQVNENAKLPAFSHELPELDHNEIEGWAGAAELGPFSAVFLADVDSHPRVQARMEVTERIVRERARTTAVVHSRGRNGLERVLSLVLLGDLVSLYLAVLRGVDPTPVNTIQRLKAEPVELGQR
jgi:glucose/mannose-6-phosphate isomerase